MPPVKFPRRISEPLPFPKRSFIRLLPSPTLFFDFGSTMVNAAIECTVWWCVLLWCGCFLSHSGRGSGFESSKAAPRHSPSLKFFGRREAAGEVRRRLLSAFVALPRRTICNHTYTLLTAHYSRSHLPKCRAGSSCNLRLLRCYGVPR